MLDWFTKDRILIIITFIIMTLVMFTYSKNKNKNRDQNTEKNRENFNQTEICDRFLKEALHKEPCSSPDTKRHFLDWCNSHRRRVGRYPRITDAMAKFDHFNRTYNLFYSLK